MIKKAFYIILMAVLLVLIKASGLIDLLFPDIF